MIEFIAAVYNEVLQIDSLLNHVYPYVDRINIVDDGSTDETLDLIDLHWLHDDKLNVTYECIPHTGLPETVKAHALEMVHDGSWVMMLDADERFGVGVLEAIRTFCNSSDAEQIDYVYFRQIEVIDGVRVREFQKCKLFRKEAMHFPLHDIHKDDVLHGEGITNANWIVYHTKTTDKQVQREMEYLSTYKKLLKAGDIDEGRYNWLIGLHHYVKPHS